MFNFITQHRKLIQVLIFLFIFPPFVFFGVDRLQSPVGSDAVAKVGDYKITQQEFNRTLRERQEAIQRATQGRASPEMLNSSELRMNVLEALIRQRTLINHAERSGIVITDDQLQRVISQIPEFQEDGKFSIRLYQESLRAQGLTVAAFESKVRRDVLLQQLDQAVGASGLVSRAVAERIARLSDQQREISHFTLSPSEFAGQVQVGAVAAKQYYDANPNEFRIPEQVRVEFVTLTLEAFLSDFAVDAAEIQKYYEANRSRYEVKEQRQASHILIAADANADAAAKQKARAKAEEILQQVKQKPDRFAELARQFSEDPGSAQKGGDLGYFQHGTMVKGFDDTVFKLNVGEVSPVVETQFGFHIIRLVGIRGGQTRSLQDVRAEIEAEFKKQRAGKKFAEISESFNNLVFEQSETLKPAAELARTTPRQSGWFSREAGVPADLNNPRLLQAIFSEEVLQNKRNTEAVEIAPGVLVAARVIERKPSALRPFDEVSAAIIARLTAQQAGQLAAQSGRERLELLRQGKEAKVEWSKPELMGRAGSKSLSEAALMRAFRVDTAKLPAYAGVEDGRGGFVLVRVTRVVDVEKVSPERQKAVADGLREVMGQEEMLAYVASLKQKAGIKISKEALDKK